MHRSKPIPEESLKEMLAVRQISRPVESMKNLQKPKAEPKLKPILKKTTSTYEKKKIVESPPKLIKNRWTSSRLEPYKKTVESKNKSALEFIEKLKQIEVRTEKANVLEETECEIDTATKQLEELRKLLDKKLNTDQPHRVVERNNVQPHRCTSELPKKIDKVLDRFSKKPRTYYKSLKNFEHLIHENTQTSRAEEQETRHHQEEQGKAIKKLFINNANLNDDSGSEVKSMLSQESGICDRRKSPERKRAHQEKPMTNNNNNNKTDQSWDFYNVVFKNTTNLEDSILQSDYLLKEFSVGPNKNLHRTNTVKSEEKMFLQLPASEDNAKQQRQQKYEDILKTSLINSLYELKK